MRPCVAALELSASPTVPTVECKQQMPERLATFGKWVQDPGVPNLQPAALRSVRQSLQHAGQVSNNLGRAEPLPHCLRLCLCSTTPLLR